MSDRLKLPSASGFSRVVECPGSEQLIASLPPAPEVADPDAERGSKIHAALASRNPIELDEEDTTLYVQALKYENEILERWQKDFDIPCVIEGPIEERFYLHDPETLQPVTSGKPDKIFLAKDHALVEDFKALWAVHVPPATQSWQLRLYAVLVWHEFGVSNVRVAHCKPMRKDGARDWADYNEDDLINSEAAIRYQLWLARQPGAPRHAGTHCQYCSARSDCPEAATMSLLPSVLTNGKVAKRGEDWGAVVESLGLQDLRFLWDRSAIIAKILEAVDKRLKGLPAEALKQIGLEIAEHGKKLDPIVDPHGAFDLLTTVHTFNPDDLWRTMKMEKGSLAELIMREKNMNEKQAKAWLAEVLKEFIEKKESEKPLREIKE